MRQPIKPVRQRAKKDPAVRDTPRIPCVEGPEARARFEILLDTLLSVPCDVRFHRKNVRNRKLSPANPFPGKLESPD